MKSFSFSSRLFFVAFLSIVAFSAEARALPTPIAEKNAPSLKAKEDIGGNTVIAEYDGDQVTYRFQKIVFQLEAGKGEQKSMTADISYNRGNFSLSLFANVRVDGCPECTIKDELILEDSYRVYDRTGELKLKHFLDFSKDYSQVHVNKVSKNVFVFGTPALDGWHHNGNKRREKGFIDVYRNSQLDDKASDYKAHVIYDSTSKQLSLLKYEEAIVTKLWARPSSEFVGAILFEHNDVIMKDASGLFLIHADGSDEQITGQGAVLDPKRPFTEKYSSFGRNEFVELDSMSGYKICVDEINRTHPTCAFYNPETKKLSSEIKDVYHFTYEYYHGERRFWQMHALQRGPNNTVRAICTEDFEPISQSPFSPPLTDDMMEDITYSGYIVSPLPSYKDGKHGVELVEGSGYERKVHLYLECSEPLAGL